ncbi:beta-ketoacyl synthase N-terminal-like domain-containing protein, partial [Streptomyces sp. NPDC059080]|uniref:beta-ketoacyl synthase N-terminal-like domain-containing protein n=1 Tax=Streptomyces sp. NPDC059080 TaxID=3346718 RepID=UPI0036A9B5DC
MGIASEADTDAGRTAPEEADAIAVVGMSCRFPGVDGPDTFWRLLHDGPGASGGPGGGGGGGAPPGPPAPPGPRPAPPRPRPPPPP